MIRDCIQNLFIKLIRNHENLTVPPSVKAYLLKSFRNHLYDALREKTFHDAMFVPCIDELLSFESEGAVFMNDGELSDDSVIIRQAFKKLSNRQQEILYLYYIMGASHTEIALR
jgi:RNA polymerase sigma-70 factor (ECF subfamily)